jgi:glyoxylase-like metal-dependent hydrolase (beta-lactamase superfamily II)
MMNKSDLPISIDGRKKFQDAFKMCVILSEQTDCFYWFEYLAHMGVVSVRKKKKDAEKDDQCLYVGHDGKWGKSIWFLRSEDQAEALTETLTNDLDDFIGAQ